MPAEYGSHALLIPTGLERALGPRAFRDFTDSLDRALAALEQQIEALEAGDTGPVAEVLTGTLAARPAPGRATTSATSAAAPTPRLYVVTGDTAARNGTAYLDTGATWQQLAGATSTTTTPTAADPVQPRTSLGYDGAGNLATITVTSADGATTISTTTLTYDPVTGLLTRSVRVTNGTGTLRTTRTRDLTYDAAGNLTLATETETTTGSAA